MKKKLIKLICIILFTLLCMFGIIYSSYKIINWKVDVSKNKKIQNEIEDKINIIESIDEEKETIYEIDFESLKKQNSDIVAYLKVNNTNIDYVVVKGKNNSYYLNHSFDKSYNIAGWIFADYRNQIDESDKNIIIYGHNTKDGSMFGTLKNILNKEWYENKDNNIITLVTEKGTYYYEVFSVYSIEAEDYYINTEFLNDEGFVKFIKTLKNRSFYNFNVEVSEINKILTLSSCIGDGKKRVVLHAKLV